MHIAHPADTGLPPTAKPVTAAETGPERAYQRLAEQVLGLIRQGEFKTGERLPSERALAERFDVSRTSLREAIIALELQGAVEVRGGSGIYVCRAPAAEIKSPAFMPEVGPGPFELLRARCLIESEIAALSAQNRKDSDIDRIFAALVDMRRHMHDKLVSDAADRRFHLNIAESTGNSVLLQMVTAMWDHAKAPIWSQMETHFHSSGLRRASQEDHQRVFDAILARDADAARTAMRSHIERVITEFTQAWR